MFRNREATAFFKLIQLSNRDILEFVMEPPIHALHTGLTTSGRHSCSLNGLREKHLHHQLIHATVNSCLMCRPPSGHLRGKIKSDSLQWLWSDTLHYFLSFAGTSSLPISSELSSILSICQSHTGAKRKTHF